MIPLPDNPFYRAMAILHLEETGHPLDALLDTTKVNDRMIRYCC